MLEEIKKLEPNKIWLRSQVRSQPFYSICSKKSDIKLLTEDTPVTSISALTGDGINKLRNLIADKITNNDMSVESSLVPNLRHKKALSKARDYFNDAAANLKNGAPMEIISIDLKGGLENLEMITGESAGDELYDSIFSQFCIGK